MPFPYHCSLCSTTQLTAHRQLNRGISTLHWWYLTGVSICVTGCSVLYGQCVIYETDALIRDNERIVGKKYDSWNWVAINLTFHQNSDAQKKTLSCSCEAYYLTRYCEGVWGQISSCIANNRCKLTQWWLIHKQVHLS